MIGRAEFAAEMFAECPRSREPLVCGSGQIGVQQSTLESCQRHRVEIGQTP